MIFRTTSNRRIHIPPSGVVKRAILFGGPIVLVLCFLTLYTAAIHGLRVQKELRHTAKKLLQDNGSAVINILSAPEVSESSQLPTYRITASPDGFNNLNHEILLHGFGDDAEKPRINAYADEEGGDLVKVKMILRGTNTWHHQIWKPSLRIRYPKSDLRNGFRNHVLISPKCPTGLSNWLSNELAGQWGVLNVEEEHVRLFINDRYFGHYTKYYTFDESLLIHQWKLPGPFFRLEADTGPQFNRISGSFDDSDTWEYIGIEKEEGRSYIDTLVSAIQQDISEASFDQMNQIVDRVGFAKYLTLRCHGGETHIDRHNVSFWLDTTSGKLVGLFADIRGYGWYNRPMNRSILGKYISDNGIRKKGISALEWKWLSDPRNLQLYIDTLYEFMNGIGSFDSVSATIDAAWADVRADAVTDMYTSEKGEWSGAGARSLWPVTQLDAEVDRLKVNVRARLSYLRDELSAASIVMMDQNPGHFRVLVKGLSGVIARRISYGLLGELEAGVSSERVLLTTLPKKIDKGDCYAMYSLSGRPEDYLFSNRVTREALTLQNAIPGENEVEVLEANMGVLADVLVEEMSPPKVFPAGEHYINETLVLAEGQQLVLEAGAHVFLQPGVSLIARGRVSALGTERNPVRVESTDPLRPFGVFAIIGEKTRGSRLEWFSIRNGSLDRWFNVSFTGMFEIRDCPKVTLSHVIVSENYIGDDALHIVRSDIELSDSQFFDTNSDSVDLDMVTGLVQNCHFFRSGNDGLDVSMGNIRVLGTRFETAGDKGISCGEGSIMDVRDCSFSKCITGFAIKDGSQGRIDDSRMEDCGIAIALYMKKWKWEKGGTVNVGKVSISGSLENDIVGDKRSSLHYSRGETDCILPGAFSLSYPGGLP